MLAGCNIVFAGLSYGCASLTGSALTGLVTMAAAWTLQVFLGLKGGAIAWEERRHTSVEALREGERRWDDAGIVFGLVVDLPRTVLVAIWTIKAPDSTPPGDVAIWVVDALQRAGFLFGPLAVGVLIALALRRGEWARAWLTPAAVSLASLSVAFTAAANAAFLGFAFSSVALAMTRSGQALAEASLSVFRSLFCSILAVIVCLAAAAVLHAVPRKVGRGTEAEPPQPLDAGLRPWVLGGVAASALAAGVLLWVNYQMADITMAAIDPRRSAEMEAEFGRSVVPVANLLSRDQNVLVNGGAILSLAALGLGLAACSLFRGRKPDRAAFSLTSVLLAVAILGAGWGAARMHVKMDYVESFLERPAASTPATGLAASP